MPPAASADARAYLKWFSITSALLLLVALFAAWTALALNYQQSNRLVNLRKLPNGLRAGALSDFFQRHAGRDDVILFLGDSQPFGYRVEEKYTAAAALGSSAKTPVLNAAFQDARPSDQLTALKQIGEARIRPSAIVLNITPSHSLQPEFGRLGRGSSALEFRALSGINLVPILASLEYRRKVEPEDRVVTDIGPITVPDDYFSTFDNPEYWALVEELLAAGARATEALLVYRTPYPPSLIEVAQIEEALGTFDVRLRGLCDRHPEVSCLDVQPLVGDEGFADVVHLNRTGHHALARLVRERLENGP